MIKVTISFHFVFRCYFLIHRFRNCTSLYFAVSLRANERSFVRIVFFYSCKCVHHLILFNTGLVVEICVRILNLSLFLYTNDLNYAFRELRGLNSHSVGSRNKSRDIFYLHMPSCIRNNRLQQKLTHNGYMHVRILIKTDMYGDPRLLFRNHIFYFESRS